MERLAHLANWSQAAHSPQASCFSATSALAAWGTWTFWGAAQECLQRWMPLRFGFCFYFLFKLDNGSMSGTCQRGKQGSRGTVEDDVGRWLRKTWAPALGRSRGEVSQFLVCIQLFPQCPPHLSLPHVRSSVFCASPIHPLHSRAKDPLSPFMLRYWGWKVLSCGMSTVIPGGGIWSEDVWEQNDLLLLTRLPLIRWPCGLACMEAAGVPWALPCPFKNSGCALG